MAAIQTMHGLITGKKASDRSAVMRKMAQEASEAGTGSFLSDCGGDLSALALTPVPDSAPENLYPCTFWDPEAKSGLPFRTTVSELGPMLLAGMLGLNEAQSDLLSIFFEIADANGLLLIDTKDLRAIIDYIIENNAEFEKTYGTINKQSAAAILRAVSALETKGGKDFLSEPAIDVKDLFGKDAAGYGWIHVLDMSERMDDEAVYAGLLLYCLSELGENISAENDESTDAKEKTGARLLVIIDEAQLLFQEDSRSFLNKMTKLLRKLLANGICVYFAAEKLSDLPESITELLAERVSIENGEAVSFITENAAGKEEPSEGEGVPGTETWALASYKKGLQIPDDAQKRALIQTDPLYEKYKVPFDRDSAYEFLQRRGIAEEGAAADPGSEIPAGDPGTGTAAESEESDADEKSGSKIDTEKLLKNAKSSAQSLGNTVAGTVGRQVGKTIGSSFGDFGETLGGNIGASLGRGIMKTFFSGD